MSDRPANAGESGNLTGHARKRNTEPTTGELAQRIDPNDPHKAEKLATMGREGADPDAGSD